MKLSNLKTGTKAKIEKILENKDVQMKLTSLGISKDAEVMMIKNESSGAIILAIGENRIILGRDLASKIEVKLL